MSANPNSSAGGGASIEARVRQLLKDHARLAADIDALADGADLYQAGMTSHASVNVMLALEGEFDVEFPDNMLKRSSFESVAAISAAIEALVGA
jgi:acyl carrier protein